MVILLLVDDPTVRAGPQQTHTMQNGDSLRRAITPHIELEYFKSVPGILKILQFILTLIIKVVPRPPYMDFVVQLTFILTSLWIWIYVFSLHKKYTINPTWIDLEFFYTIGATFFYVVMTVITFADASYYTRAAVFGLFNCLAFGGGTFFLFKDWQEARQNKIATTTIHHQPPTMHTSVRVDETNNTSNTGYI